MKTLTRLLLALVLLLGLLHPTGTWAQETADFVPGPTYTNCFPGGPRIRPATTGQRPTSTSTVYYSPYGKDVTPQGTLKILVIFAGFTNDVDLSSPDYAQNPSNTNDWPQEDGIHPPGLSFPRNPGSSFYTNPASFQATALDGTLSNFYFQMSQHSPNPFKMQAVFFPKRINVLADDTTNKYSGFLAYNQQVLDAIRNDPDTRNFNFGQVDQRGASPNFQADNSAVAPDHTIDYTVIVWRNPGKPLGSRISPYLGGGGFASLAAYTTVTSSNGQTYSFGQGFTQTFGMSGLDGELFEHEFAHTLYDSPHYFMANSVTGLYFDATEGPGMMSYFKTHHAANAWERWYNGWIELQTGASHANSDIQGPASLTATNGEFTLRDYVTTGDVMRIKIPNTTPAQYLWLENHQHRSVFDERLRYTENTQTPPQPLRGAPTGILAMVENMAGSRNEMVMDYPGFNDLKDCNGLRVLSAQGNFDYQPTSSSTYNNYFFNNLLYDYSTVANPFGGQSQISRRRLDLNQNGIINNNRTGGNVDAPKSEISYSIRANGAFEDGMFGPDAAFNTVGPNTVGRKMGISYNPAIFEHQQYDQANAKLSPIKLNGLSVELIAKDATTGAITVKVRYNDTDIVQNTRWSGDLLVQKNFDLAAGASDVHVTNNAQLVINKSGTNNRHTKTAANDFINPTTLICDNASKFLVDGGAAVSVEGDQTMFRVRAGAQLNLAANASFRVGAGSALILESGSACTIAQGGTIQVEAGGTLIIRAQATVSGQGGLSIASGGYLCVGTGAVLSTGPNFVFYVSPTAIMGANSTLGNQGFSSLTCNGQLQFCGQLSGGNSSISVICPTGNEALLFDGVDDVVTIPVPQNIPAGASSPIHNIGDTFTIEATLRSDASGGPNQTIFSNREIDPDGDTRGLLFTLYAGQYLLLQINGQSYYDFSDPLMAIAPNSGCHQVAVTRDESFRVHFYIDGLPAAYSPTVYASPYSTASVRFGGDVPYAPAQAFNGQIGEVRYWDYFRTDAEILRYLSTQLGTPYTEFDLKGYYDMRDVSGQIVADKAIVYNPSYPYVSPTGFLGTTNGPEASDPTWVAAANLTCNVGGNFRQFSSGKNAQDSTSQATKNQPGTTTTVSELAIFPNPASREATMHFQLREAGKVAVTIQDVTGYTRAIALPTTMLDAGTHNVQLPLHALLPGIYLVVVNSQDGRTVIRLEVK